MTTVAAAIVIITHFQLPSLHESAVILSLKLTLTHIVTKIRRQHNMYYKNKREVNITNVSQKPFLQQ